MKRASYRHGVEIIALNDEPAEMDVEVVSAMISVALLADLFGIESLRVAGDVVRYRTDAASKPGEKRPKIWSRS
jgi:hypothetical protein